MAVQVNASRHLQVATVLGMGLLKHLKLSRQLLVSCMPVQCGETGSYFLSYK